MSVIEIKDGADTEQLITFYSCLYRGMIYPSKAYEYDDSGNIIHRSPYNNAVTSGYMHYNVGFWDSCKALYSLLTIISPDFTAQTLCSWINAYKEGGWLPRWPSPGYFSCMDGTPLPNIFYDAYSKNIFSADSFSTDSKVDYNLAYLACKKDATVTGVTTDAYGRLGLAEYNTLGYVPCDIGICGSASRTLQYAGNDYSLAQLAKSLGNTNDYNSFIANSLKYKNVFTEVLYDWASEEYMCPSGRNSNGTFLPGCAEAWGGPFTEGNAWEYAFYPAFDATGLIQLFGGTDNFENALDVMFSPYSGGGKFYSDWWSTRAEFFDYYRSSSSAFGQYNPTNETGIHTPYMYNFIGKPFKTAKIVRSVVDNIYASGCTSPENFINGGNPGLNGLGYTGDEDNGAMSAVYIFHTLGFFPVIPGYASPFYAIGSPRFNDVAINLPGGNTFEIIANNNSADNIYIQSAALNGQPYTKSWISHSDIVNGGKIVFEMGPQPSSWGTNPGDMPQTSVGKPGTK